MAQPVARLGDLSDVEPAIAVWLAAHDARHGARSISAEDESRVRDRARQPDTFLIVADDDGAIVGMSLAMQGRADDGAGPPVPDLCFIAMVYVAPDPWGEGLGRAVVEAVLAEGRSRGYGRAQLWTADDNLRARRLYGGCGFRPTGRELTNQRGRTELQFERLL